MDQISEPGQHSASPTSRYFAYFCAAPLDEAEHLNCRSRAKVLVISSHLGALLTFVATTLRTVSGALPSLAYLGAISALGLALFFAPFVLKRTQSVQRAALLPLGALALLLPMLLGRTGGLSAASMMMLPALPIIAAFFAGFRVALVFAVLLALETIGLGVFSHLGWIPPHETPLSLRAMLGVAYIGTTAAIAYVYEREREAAEARSRALADALYDATIRDPLTNLLNRRFFDERLKNELAFSRRHGSFTSLLSLDVDHFKRVNDTYGHAGGDTVLVELAHILRASIRQEDTVARIGGEEFLILLRQTEPVGARTVAERLRAAIAAHGFVVGAERIAATASIGCATTTGGDDAQALLSRADARMYVAKRTGRNRVVGDPVAARSSAPRSGTTTPAACPS